MPWKVRPSDGVGLIHGIAAADRGQVAVEDVSLHPDGGDVADHEAGGLSGLNHLAGGDQLLHDHAGDGRADGELRIDGGALLFGLGDSFSGDAEDAQGLQGVLHVGPGVVEIGLGCSRSL